jgi:hypothetical protein
MTIGGVGIAIRIYWTLKTHNSWLHFTHHSHTQTSVLSHGLHWAASDNVPSSASVSNGSCPHWLAPFSWSSQAELTHKSKSKLCYNRRSVGQSVLVWSPRFISSQSQSHIATDGQSVSFAVEPHLGLMTRYLLLFDSYGLVFVGRPLWREDGSVFCICYYFPAQSFSGPSPLCSLGTDRIENHTNNSSIVASRSYRHRPRRKRCF